MWLLSVCQREHPAGYLPGQAVCKFGVLTGCENLALLPAVGAVELRCTLLRGFVITEHQVAQVQGEGGAAVISERIDSFAGQGAEGDNVVRLRQGGNQVRGGFVAVLVAGQDDAVRLRVSLGSAGTGSCSTGGKVSLEDLFNTANQVGIGQGATLRCRGKRNVDAVQRLVRGARPRNVRRREHSRSAAAPPGR